MLTLVGEKRDVLNLAFTPDGSTLAVGGGYSAIEIWEIMSATIVDRIDINLGYYLDALRLTAVDSGFSWFHKSIG